MELEQLHGIIEIKKERTIQMSVTVQCVTAVDKLSMALIVL